MRRKEEWSFFRSQSQNFLHELGRYQLIQFCIAGNW